MGTFDKVGLMANVDFNVGLASKEDVFDIAILEEGKTSVSEMAVSFGEQYLQDHSNNNKLLRFVDIEDDKYGTPCAMWFRHLSIPKVLSSQYDKDCCFYFQMQGKGHYICSNRDYHCILETFMIMKTLREGCEQGVEGLELSTSPSLFGDERNPNTEVTGDQKDGSRAFYEEEQAE